jgi:hypothetical protein
VASFTEPLAAAIRAGPGVHRAHMRRRPLAPARRSHAHAPHRGRELGARRPGGHRARRRPSQRHIRRQRAGIHLHPRPVLAESPNNSPSFTPLQSSSLHLRTRTSTPSTYPIESNYSATRPAPANHSITRPAHPLN